MFTFVVSVLMFLVVMAVGVVILRALAQPVPGPLPPGEMRKVNLRFRCSVCGAEVKMTVAAEQEPEPPRHCLEDMQLVAPIIE